MLGAQSAPRSTDTSAETTVPSYNALYAASLLQKG